MYDMHRATNRMKRFDLKGFTVVGVFMVVAIGMAIFQSLILLLIKQWEGPCVEDLFPYNTMRDIDDNPRYVGPFALYYKGHKKWHTIHLHIPYNNHSFRESHTVLE